MEKLIKLLDEYDHKKTEDLERWKQRVDNQKLWIISKQFWFIERLIKNGKYYDRRLEVIHLNWNQMDCRVENLKVTTPSERWFNYHKNKREKNK